MRITVGLKYCGGCTPRFDRTEFVDNLRKITSERVRLVHYEDPAAERILVVAGCETACVDLEPFQDKIVHLVTSEDDLERIAEELLSTDG